MTDLAHSGIVLMDTNIIIVLAILSATVLMLIFEVVRIDVVAICCMLALGWTGILTPGEMFSGFSSNAVIAMMSVMILGRGIARTGIMENFSGFAIKKAGTSKRKLISLISFFVGIISGFIQNIGAAALFLPGIMQVSRRTGIPASSLIMPIGFSAILGGTLTMVGSGPLILVNDLLRNAGLESYNLFSVTPVGVMLLLSGIGFFLVFGNKVLPSREIKNEGPTEQEKLIEKLHLPHNIRLLNVTGNSTLAGKTTEQSGIWDSYKINVLGIGKGDEVIYAPWRETMFEEGQTIAVLGTTDNIDRFLKDFNLEDNSPAKYFSGDFDPYKSGFAELIVPPGSELTGKNIRGYSLRRRFAVEPVLLFHKGEKVEGDFSDIIIAPGDTLIVYGRWEKISDIRDNHDFIVITHSDAEKRDPSKAWLASACFLSGVVLAMLGFPISMAFLTGALCMVLGRVLSIGDAYKAIEWKVVFLLAGLIPLGVAMEKTGTAKFLAESIMSLVIDLHPFVLILTIGLLSTLFSLFMSNVGAIVVLAPLVMGMANIAGIDPKPVALMAAVCAANSFILPTHQVNALLMSSGGYRNADYLRAGSGMTLIFLSVVVLMFYFIII